MTIVYNPFLVANMLDRAGHPATPDQEALLAVRMANDHCSTRGKTIGDVVRLVDGPLYVEAGRMPKADLLREIAELRSARDDAQARVRAQAEMIVDLKRARDEDALTISGLRAKIAGLVEKLVSEATPAMPDPVAAMVDEALSADAPPTDMLRTAGSEIDNRVDHARTSVPIEVEAVVSAHCDAGPAREPDNRVRSTWAEYARFSQLAALGRARSSIARTLCREFGRRFSVSRVAEMMRQRWFSPTYLGC